MEVQIQKVIPTAEQPEDIISRNYNKHKSIKTNNIITGVQVRLVIKPKQDNPIKPKQDNPTTKKMNSSIIIKLTDMTTMKNHNNEITNSTYNIF